MIDNRELGIRNIQFDIGWELADVTVRAQVYRRA